MRTSLACSRRQPRRLRLVKHRLQIVDDSNQLARTAAGLITDRILETTARGQLFSIALSGGSTPKSLYELLANPAAEFRARIHWDQVHFFWTDERNVPPDDRDSNYRMAFEAMLSHVPVSPLNVHRVRTEVGDTNDAASDYEKQLCDFFTLEPGEFPSFDLILLGLGTDGHTASIFPASSLLHERDRLVANPWVESLRSYRITLTLPVLNNGQLVLFLVSGEEKAKTLRDVLQTQPNPDRLPAQAVNPTKGELLWLVDAAAAKLLQS